MSLPTVAQVLAVAADPTATDADVTALLDATKRTLKVQSAAEDALFYDLLAGAIAAAQGYLGRPIRRTSQTFEDRACTLRRWASVTTLLIPTTPVDTAATTPVVTDVDGDTVDETTYTIPNPWTGEIRANLGESFTNGPYTIECDVGLEVSSQPDYVCEIEPAITRAVIAIVADEYQRRNPNASSESSGGGVSQSYSALGLPSRACALLDLYKRVRVV